MTPVEPTYSREEQSRREVGVTAISRGAAVAALLIFLVTLAIVPLFDQTHGASTAWRRFTASGDLRQSLRDVEQTLEDRSTFARHVRPPAQTLLATLSAGNENVHIGRGGWLFYAPDVRHVTMRGFLDAAADDPESLRRRQRPSDRHRDPVAAILHFNAQLAARGVRLVIVPTPVKPMVQPEMLWPSSRGPLVNASFEEFKREMEAAGVLVFDPTTDLAAAAAREGKPQFLATDTHWRPEAMDGVATRLAAFVEENVELPQTLGVEYTLREQTVQGRGDLAAMLQLLKPPSPEEVVIQQVIAPDGRPWSPQKKAEILWLGDSFSNIYSAGPMGWGESAGFAEQFSRHLGRPLDALRRNDDGAFATRQTLADDMARGDDRLAGKKLVVWQFAARELSFGDWKPIELKLGERPTRRFLVPPPGEVWTIDGTVASQGVAPRPGNVAYRDHLIAVHLTNVKIEGRADSGEAVVYLRSMIDGRLTDAASLQIGQAVRLKVRDWSEVARQYEFIHRSELPSAELRAQTACWGEIVP